MRSRHRSSPLFPRIALGLIGLALSGVGHAQPSDPGGPFSALIRSDDRLQPREVLKPLAEVRAGLAADLESTWNGFLLQHGEWNAYVDARNGTVESAEGPGIPWIPGAGNRLSPEDLDKTLADGAKPDLALLEKLARKFVADNVALLGIPEKELALASGRSGKASDSLWLVDFDLVREGLRVEGARIVFRVGHGNLIQFGSELVPPAAAAVPPIKTTREEAHEILAKYVGGFDPLADAFVDRGSLHLLPVAIRDDRFADGFEWGRGYGLSAVWQIAFRREGVLGTWRGRVDAATGEVVEFLNTDLDARAKGGIAADSVAGTETSRPLPFTNLGGGLFTNSAGVYNFTGVPRTSTLNGQFVAISDTCGPISLTSAAALQN